MSFPHLPSSQADQRYQQRAIQPPHALAPRPQSTVVLGFQSVVIPGQATGSQFDHCQHFAEVMTSTCEWVPVSTTDMKRLGAPNGPSQIVLNGMPSGIPPFTGNGPEQKYVSKPSQHFLNSMYWNLTDSCRAQCGTSQPTQVPIEGMRTTSSRGPAFFNSESQAGASQLRASGMGPASYVGAPHEGR